MFLLNGGGVEDEKIFSRSVYDFARIVIMATLKLLLLSHLSYHTRPIL